MKIKDVNKSFPFNATTLGEEIGKGQQWVANAADILGLKEDDSCCCNILESNGQIVLRKYSNEALRRIKEVLANDPNFYPYP